MAADRDGVQSAADIVRCIDELVELRPLLEDGVAEGITSALMALDHAPCESHADALAFIAMARRVTDFIVRDLVQGGEPALELAEAADRYMETALAFLRAEDARRRYGHFGGPTLH
ncbi:hypothetical protein ACLE20_06925 [Rhizobium sp. YIM 134829]|uniref:hypothetical protein n=1 Tax=Rhizobium sp. YIM 134829 TaxID=3390453 RepID=UPI00397D2FFB